MHSYSRASCRQPKNEEYTSVVFSSKLAMTCNRCSCLMVTAEFVCHTRYIMQVTMIGNFTFTLLSIFE